MEWKDRTDTEKADILEHCAIAVFVAAGLVLAATIMWYAPWPFKVAVGCIAAGAILSLASNYYIFR